MGKSLIIAEKNSMARDIVSAIGGCTYNKKEGYYENNKYIVMSLLGHVMTLYDMEDYDEKLKAWDLDYLPFFPKQWKLKVKKEPYLKQKYNLAQKLINSKEVDEIINAGDPDTEGEVLVNEVIYSVFDSKHIQKNIKRIWIKDHVARTILQELKYARDIKNTNNIYEEGLARSHIDWLYGINLTRYVTLMADANTPFNTGRVIIPAVRYVYDRDLEIENFKPKTYYVVLPTISKENKDIKLNFNDLKFDSKEEANKVLLILKNQKIKVNKIEKQEKKKEPKKLFSLSTLQVYMSKKFKYSPDDTLNTVQKLYEAGYLTYPRTNSEYMTEAEISKAENIIKALNNTGFTDVKIKNTKKIFDDTKIDSHSAITPTEKIADLNSLSGKEKELYQVVRNRFLANFVTEDCKLDVTKISFTFGEYKCNLTGTIIKQEGYLKYENDLNEKELPKFEEGEMFVPKQLDIEEKVTTPPQKVTEAELIQFFNKPFKNFEKESDDDESDDTEDYKKLLKGIEIGTEATRASTIKKIIDVYYISKDKNGKLSITDKGKAFIEILQKLNINLWKEKTVELSQKLKEVHNSKITVDEVEKEAEDEIKSIIQQKVENVAVSDLNFKNSNKNNNSKEIGICPSCGKKILLLKGKYGTYYKCENCDFKISGKIAGKNITQSIVKELLKNGETKKIDGFISKAGKKFTSKLFLNPNTKKVEFKFN